MQPGVNDANQPWTPDTVGEGGFLPLCLILFYFVETMLTIASYVGFVRYNQELVGRDIRRAYLAFVVIGVSVYAFISAIFWVWAAKYVASSKTRRVKTTWGLAAVFLFHDLPIFAMEWTVHLKHGWINDLFGVVFIFHAVAFVCSGCSVWLSYAWMVSGICEANYGDTYQDAPDVDRSGLRGTLQTGLNPPQLESSLDRPLISRSPHRRSRSNSPHRREEISRDYYYKNVQRGGGGGRSRSPVLSEVQDPWLSGEAVIHPEHTRKYTSETFRTIYGERD